MKTFQLFSTPVFLLLTLFGTLVFTACDDNPASGGEEHAEAEGLELVHDGEVIYEYFDGELTEHSHQHFHVGEEYFFEVHFLDEDGEHIHAEDFDEGYSLDWEIENEDILEIHQHEEDGRWNFHLEGIAEGGSNVQFLLDHSDHSHLETPEIEEENAIEFHIDADDDGEHEH